MLRHIRRFTEEAHKALQGDEWSLSLEELDVFMSIIYARGVYVATTLKLHELWNRLWRPPSSAETRNRFIEIMIFLRFDFK